MIIHTTTLDTMEKVIAIYGGTQWVKIEGKFLLGTSSSHAINTTGGEENHTLSIAEMPNHRHAENLCVYGYSNWDSTTLGNYSIAFPYSGENYTTQKKVNAAVVSANADTGACGSGVSHNNMPPYKTVYIWERTE